MVAGLGERLNIPAAKTPLGIGLICNEPIAERSWSVDKNHRGAFICRELDKLAAGLSCGRTFTCIYDLRRHQETLFVKKQRVILWVVLGGIPEREIFGSEGFKTKLCTGRVRIRRRCREGGVFFIILGAGQLRSGLVGLRGNQRYSILNSFLFC